MLDYMISLFGDANGFSWDVAKASHTVLLCRREQEKVKDYSQTEKKLTGYVVLMHRGIMFQHLVVRTIRNKPKTREVHAM